MSEHATRYPRDEVSCGMEGDDVWLLPLEGEKMEILFPLPKLGLALPLTLPAPHLFNNSHRRHQMPLVIIDDCT